MSFLPCYANQAVNNFSKLMPIYKQIKEMLKVCYEEWGFEWKKEYDSIFE